MGGPRPPVHLVHSEASWGSLEGEEGEEGEAGEAAGTEWEPERGRTGSGRGPRSGRPVSVLPRCEFHLCHQANGLRPTELLSRSKAFFRRMCLAFSTC